MVRDIYKEKQKSAIPRGKDGRFQSKHEVKFFRGLLLAILAGAVVGTMLAQCAAPAHAKINSIKYSFTVKHI